MLRRVLFFALIVIFVSIACGLPDSVAEPVEGPGEVVAAENSEEVVEEPAPAEGPATLSFADVGFASEGNRIEEIILTFTGNTSGASFALMARTEVQVEPYEAIRVAISGNQPGGEEGSLEAVVIGDTAYSTLPGGVCFSLPAAEVQSQQEFFDLNEFDDSATSDIQRVNTGVEVDGILTDEYALTAANLPAPESEDDVVFERGSVFVSRDTGQMVRVLMSGAGGGGSNPEGFQEGETITLEYDIAVTPVDGLLNIAPPVDCDLDPGDFLIMEDAQDVAVLPNGVLYNSTSPLYAVLDFYRSGLPPVGWSLVAENVDLPATELIFTREGETLTISAYQSGALTTVAVQSSTQ